MSVISSRHILRDANEDDTMLKLVVALFIVAIALSLAVPVASDTTPAGITPTATISAHVPLPTGTPAAILYCPVVRKSQ